MTLNSRLGGYRQYDLDCRGCDFADPDKSGLHLGGILHMSRSPLSADQWTPDLPNGSNSVSSCQDSECFWEFFESQHSEVWDSADSHSH